MRKRKNHKCDKQDQGLRPQTQCATVIGPQTINENRTLGIHDDFKFSVPGQIRIFLSFLLNNMDIHDSKFSVTGKIRIF